MSKGTIYAGEMLRVAAHIEGQDAPGLFRLLGPDDISAALISVWSEPGRVIVEEEEMSFDSDHSFWFYLWDTAGCLPGRYQIRTTFVGDGDRRTWEEEVVTLHASKHPIVVMVP